MLFHDVLLHAEATAARRLATIDGDARRSYAEVAARVRRAAGGLRAMGLAAGDRVALIGLNSAAYLEAYFALSLAGLVAVPINTRLSAGEVAFILDDCATSAVLADNALAGLAGGGRPVVPLDGDGWERFLAGSPPLDEPVAGTSEDSVAHIFYTGGTTGRPKGVMLSHRNVVSSATNKVVLGAFRRDDVWLHAVPMFHQADAWAVVSFTGLGARHVFLPSFAPGPALDLIERERGVGVQLVPTMIFMMLDQPGAATRDLAAIRRILYGSAPMPTAMLERATDVFGDVFQHIYGLTECAGTVATTPWPPEPAERAGARMASCGQQVTGVRLRIADDAGRVLPPGEIGRIQARGANVMLGYWGRPEETEAAFVDGWLDTGDLGHMDDEGFVFIVDRAKDMIITGGENVYSTEVEDALYAHPDVAEAAVIGEPDPKWGEAVTAVVRLRDGASADALALIQHCRDRLAAYKAPKSVRFVETMPKSAAGKILKRELRPPAEEETSR